MNAFIVNLLKSKTLYCAIFFIVLIFLFMKASQPSYSDFVVTTPSGKSTPTVFPFMSSSSESGLYKLNGTMTMGKYSSPILRIVPDDEIHGLIVNKKNVDLNIVPYEQRRDYTKGFIYDLTPYLHEGANELEILYSDGGGMMGIGVSAIGNEKFYTSLYILFVIAAVLLALQVLKTGKFKTSIKVLFIGALVIRLIYFMVTPADVRDHDIGDHFGYTEYLATHWIPPSVDYATGGAFFHPPLYYYTSAVVYKVTQLFDPFNKVAAFRVQQILSLTYGMGFALFGLLIINKLLDYYRKDEPPGEEIPTAENNWRAAFKQHGVFWITGALFVFWPSSVVHSVRVGNDPMLYFLFSASLYYIFRWYESDKKRDLMIASILGALAIITKANGEILIAVIGVIGLYKMIKSRQWLDYLKLSILPVIIMFTAVAITVTPALILNLQGKRDHLYIDNLSGISTANLVGNTAVNYFWFDAKIFITEPYADPYDDRMGRQFFWNYLGKTGLIGEFKYPELRSINLTVFLSFISMFMVLYVFCGLYYMIKEDFKRMGAILLSGFFLWAGVTYMRMTFPANIDFRYIIPILITFCSLYGVSILTFQRIGATRMAGIGTAMSLLFTLAGILFVLALI